MKAQNSNTIINTGIVRLLLFLGLLAITIAISKQQLMIALAIATIPMIIAIGLYSLSRPYVVYLIYALYACTFTTIMRYSRIDGLSVVLDVLLVFALISLLCSSYIRRNIQWKKAVNILTLSYIPWVFFILFEFINPFTQSDSVITGLRAWIGENLILYIIVTILSDRWKVLKIGMMTISIYIFVCFIKLLWQKYMGFDSAEQYFLYEQGAESTHLLHSGTRYFSFLSDAATFGTLMSTAAFVFGVAAIKTNSRRTTIWYVFIAICSIFGQFLSGTRGSLVIPAVGMILYTLLCKNIKMSFTMAFIGILIYSFFTFTEIGNDNQFIRRARTAFHPSKDESMNVRLINRVKIAEYLKRNPLGAGIKHMVPTLRMNDEGLLVDDIIPADSFYVSVWSQTGYFGLFLLLCIHGIVIIVCSYIVMMKIKDPELRQILIAFTCAVLGIYVSGYTSYSPDQPPINFLIPAMIAFVINGPYIDTEIRELKKQSNTLTTSSHV